MGPGIGDCRPRSGGREIRARDRRRGDGGDRRRRGAQLLPVLDHGPDTLSLRVRLFRPARQPDVRAGHPRGETADGRDIGRRAPGRSRRGRPGTRVGATGCTGFRRRQRHPLLRRPGQEPLYRPHLHRAQPEPARSRDQAQAEPDTGQPQRKEGGPGRRLDRARLDHPETGPHGARCRGHRGPSPRVFPSLPLALLLRHGHLGPEHAHRGIPRGRRDQRAHRGRLPRLLVTAGPARCDRSRRRRVLHGLSLRQLSDRGPGGSRQVPARALTK